MQNGVIGLVAGGVLGLGAGWMLGSSGSVPLPPESSDPSGTAPTLLEPPPVAEAEPPAPSPVAPEVPDVPHIPPVPLPREDEAPQTLESCEAQRQVLRGQLQLYGAVPIEWDPTLDRWADEVESWASTAVEGRDGLTLGQFDCSEYPCLMRIDYTQGQRSSEAVVGLVNDFESEFGSELSVSMRCNNATCTSMLPLISEDVDPPGLDRRLEVRQQAMGEDAMAAQD